MTHPAKADPARSFLSCDWGTSAFRLRLVDLATLKPLAEHRSRDGIAATFASWSAGGEGAGNRWLHYLSVIKRQISALERSASPPLAGLPLVVSGMASSSLGMLVLPYKDMPFAVDGSDVPARRFAASGDFPHDMLVISGMRSADDVMRGEEVQLVGALSGEAPAAERVMIFPGTHSKHVVVRGPLAIGLRTFMTGEFFDLLTRESILSESVEPGGEWTERGNRAAFEEGVREGSLGDTLHSCFRVRTRALLGQAARSANYHYLSGVLTGNELRETAANNPGEVVIVAEPEPASRYGHALRTLGAKGRVTVKSVADSIARGHARVASLSGLL